MFVNLSVQCSERQRQTERERERLKAAKRTDSANNPDIYLVYYLLMMGQISMQARERERGR